MNYKHLLSTALVAVALSGCAFLGIEHAPTNLRQTAIIVEKGYFTATSAVVEVCAPTDMRDNCVKARNVDTAYAWPALRVVYVGATHTTWKEGDPTNEELGAAHALSLGSHNALHGIIEPLTVPGIEPEPVDTGQPTS